MSHYLIAMLLNDPDENENIIDVHPDVTNKLKIKMKQVIEDCSN